MAKVPNQVNLYELVKADSAKEAGESSRFQPGAIGVVVGRFISSAGQGRYTIIPQFELIQDENNQPIYLMGIDADEVTSDDPQTKPSGMKFSSQAINLQSRKKKPKEGKDETS